MKFLRAGDVAEKVASFVNLEPDDERIYLYLSLAQKNAWKGGIYKGFMQEFNVNTYKIGDDRYIICPDGYNVLMGLNLNERPVVIRESYFQWHHNLKKGAYQDYALEFRESPTRMGPDMLQNDRPFKLGVKARTPERDPNQPNIWLKTVITYQDPNDDPHRIEVPLHGCEMLMVDDRYISRITSITKPPTKDSVDYYAIYEDGHKEAVCIATVHPYETRSIYRLYKLPPACSYECVRCLFKISEPADIVSPDQMMVLDDLEAIISLVMAMDLKFSKGRLEEGNALNIMGLANLDAELKSTKSPTLQPVQLVGLGDEDFYLTEW